MFKLETTCSHVQHNISHNWCFVSFKNYLPEHILRTIFNSLILPHLQCAVLAWGFKLGRVELLQKRAVRVITCSTYNVHTEPLFKQLNLLKVKDIFELTALKSFYKLKKNCLPVYITGMFQDFSREHDHNTRQHLILNNVFSSSRYSKKCIRFYLPIIVNILEKVMTHCYRGFIFYIKKLWLTDMWLIARFVVVISVIVTDDMHLV